MAKKSGMTLNTKDFDIKFLRVGNIEIPSAAASAFYRVGAMVIRDAILEEPRAPHDTGNLWRSQLIEQPELKYGAISIEVGFDADYAALVHEMPAGVVFKMTGAGSKYLEAKLIKNKEKYMAELTRGMQGPGRK